MGATQLSLLRERESIQAAFWRFHDKHPEVLAAIVEIARDAKSRGYRTWSINGVFEILRWSQKYRELREKLNIADGEGFALNNNFRSRYVRLVEGNHPDLKGFFKTRELKSQ